MAFKRPETKTPAGAWPRVVATGSSRARAERYLDDEPANDPLTWREGDQICVGCHASVE